MSIIRVLPVDLSNKIAAGEVIERPASVVKELVENSIDAGSTYIRVEVLNGGKRMIKVSDNGTGMDRDDALICFTRHATSKLSAVEDLFGIRTLGFRGEALPSIASVSRTRLVTGTKHGPYGTSIEMAGGETPEIKDAAASGTIVEVRDLFFNTPARRKFLKTNQTELFHIIGHLTKEALSHTGIGFSLFSDGKEALQLPAASGFRERIMQVFGEEFLAGLVETKSKVSGIEMTAFISDSKSFRNSRDHQYIFINRRPVKDQSISHAVYKAYEGIMPAERHPVYFIYLEMDPSMVDFNVHPTKREVRFQDKETIYRFVNSGIKEMVKGDREEYAKPFSMPQAGHHPVVFNEQHTPQADMGSIFVTEERGFDYTVSLPYIYLGDTFIAVSGKGGLTLLDYHAAHERVLYERLLDRVQITAAPMLFPEQIRLSHREYLLIIGNLELMKELGLDVEDFGHDTVIVRSLPDKLSGADLRGILTDVASAIMEGLPPGKNLKEAVAARIACHGSVRGREILSKDEVARLLADLEKTDNPDQCPHGRPTRVFFSLDDLARMFKRK